MKENIEKDMKPKLIKDLGTRPKGKNNHKVRFGIYECPYCEKGWEAGIMDINRGRIKSCGCHSKNRTHGMRNHRLYNIWKNMMRRCYNEKDRAYIWYGARGIIICERWHSIENFIEDMFPSFEEGLTLDRINNQENYCKENCRWVSQEVQTRNTRKIRSTNTSGFRGAGWDKKDKKFRARISISNKLIHLGSYDDLMLAVLAYDTYIRENNLEHTKNFSDEEYEALKLKYEVGD